MVKFFSCRWSDEQFGSECIAFIVLLLVFVGVQSLLFWIGGFFPAVKNLGLWLNIILSFVLWLPMLYYSACDEYDEHLLQFFSLLATGGLYLCMVWCCPLGLFIGCLAMLLFCLWVSERENIFYTDSMCQFIGGHLLYNLSIYATMQLNGFEPAMNFTELMILAIMSIAIWFKPCFD